jgi:hypothetical protein
MFLLQFDFTALSLTQHIDVTYLIFDLLISASLADQMRSGSISCLFVLLFWDRQKTLIDKVIV